MHAQSSFGSPTPPLGPDNTPYFRTSGHDEYTQTKRILEKFDLALQQPGAELRV